jgi:hypothetical protein
MVESYGSAGRKQKLLPVKMDFRTRHERVARKGEVENRVAN